MPQFHRSKKRRVFFAVLGIPAISFLAVLVGATLLFIFLPVIEEFLPQSIRERNMKEAVLACGQLAPFPETAHDFKILTYGNFMNRTFKGSFTDEPANIIKWLAASHGYPSQSVGTDGKAQLDCADGGDTGWIKTSQGCTEVEFAIRMN